MPVWPSSLYNNKINFMVEYRIVYERRLTCVCVFFFYTTDKLKPTYTSTHIWRNCNVHYRQVETKNYTTNKRKPVVLLILYGKDKSLWRRWSVKILPFHKGKSTIIFSDEKVQIILNFTDDYIMFGRWSWKGMECKCLRWYLIFCSPVFWKRPTSLPNAKQQLFSVTW